MLLAPHMEVFEKHRTSSKIDLLQSMCLDALAEACLKTAALTAVNTLLLSFWANLGFAHCAHHPEFRCFSRTPDDSEVYIPVKAKAKSELGTAVTCNNHTSFMDLWCFETMISGKSALQAYKFNSLAEWCSFEGGKQWVECRWNVIEPSFLPQLTVLMNCRGSKDSSSSSCNSHGNYGFVEGPDTNVRLIRKEMNAWFAVATNKDDEGDDDNEDDEDEDDEDEGDDDDEGDEEGAGDEEGEEGVEGGEGIEDGDGGDDDDNDDDDNEEGDDEDEEEAGEGEEDEDGVEDEGGVEGEEGDDDDDQGDEDKDEDDEVSEPPKKKRK